MDTGQSASARLFHLSDDQLVTDFGELYSELIPKLSADSLDDYQCTISVIQRFIKSNCQSLNLEAFAHLTRISVDLKQFYVTNITKIDSLALKKLSDTTSCDQFCVFICNNYEALSCFQKMFQELSSRRLLISDVHSITSDAMAVLSTTFRHCREHAQFYSTMSSTVNESISNLFRKCNELLFQCLELIKCMIVDYSDDAHVEKLNSVLLSTFEMGTVVSNLELKTMAQLWKCFTSLAQTHASSLRDQFNITRVIRYFCGEITEKVATIYDVPAKTRTVSLKIANFLLKIVIKLCKYFGGSLDQCLRDLCQLVLSLYRHSNPCAKYAGRNAEIAAEIEQSLLVAIDPLITTLLQESGFIEHFLRLNPEERNTSSSISKLLLLSEILKKLVLLPVDVRSTWLCRAIFESVFDNIDTHSAELHFDVRIAVPSVSLQLPQDVNLYDAVLVHLACLIISAVTQDEFHYVETLLVAYLLRSSIAMKLFICDLWCIISRYGSPDMRFEHTKIIVKILRMLHPEKNDVVIMKSLLKRFFKFLSRPQQQQIVSFVDYDSDLIVEIGSANEEILLRCNESLNTKIKERSHQLSNRVAVIGAQDVDLLRYIEITCKLNDENVPLEQEINQYIHSVWNQLLYAEPRDCGVFLQCIRHLGIVSRLHLVPNGSTLPVIELLVSCECIFLKLITLDYLKNLGHRAADDISSDSFTSSIASCFRSLMTDENPLVRERALEAFSYFSHVTIYENIIRITIANEPRIRKSITNFLQKKVNPLVSSKKTSDDYLKNLLSCRLPDIALNCSSKVTILKESGVESHQSKKMKFDFDFEDESGDIESRMKSLLSHMKGGELSQHQKDSLKRVLNTADELRKYL